MAAAQGECPSLTGRGGGAAGESSFRGAKEGSMLGIKLVRLIEAHSEALSQGLTEQIRRSERTSDFQKIPPKDLRLAATEVYRNLGEWLLQKTEGDIEIRFKAIAARRILPKVSVCINWRGL
jgi:hypothetical protein